MQIYYNIEQGSPEWHQIRYGKITGTSSKGLFVDSDTLLNDLIGCRMEKFVLEPHGYENDAMIRGKELEPFARMELSRKIKMPLKQAGWIQNTELSLIGISPDSLTECEEIATEIKCPGRSVHIATLIANDIPSSNIHQCLHYFTVMPKLKQLHFGSFRPECKIRLFHKVLTPESIINLGTAKTPKLGTVLEFSQKARDVANKLEIDINAAIEKLCPSAQVNHSSN